MVDIATVVKAAKGAEKAVNTVKKWIERDRSRRIVVKEDIVLGRFADPVELPDGRKLSVPDFHCPDFQIVDRVYTFFKTGDRDPICDGATFFPDRILTFDLVKAALHHDGLYEYLEELAKAWKDAGWTEDDIRWLADGGYGCTAEAEADRQKNPAMKALGHVITNFTHSMIRWFGGIYHKSRKGTVAAVALSFLFVIGCVAIPPVFEPSEDRPVYEVITVAPSGGDAPAQPHEAGPDQSGTSAVTDGDMVDFASLSWSYGGFRGGAATLAAGCRITGLEVGERGMSYRWSEGGCEQLGAADRGDCNQTLACFFVLDSSGSWRGGKFDWISTSRTTRSFANIRGEYHGWPSDSIETARGYAFVIVSKDGKRRTNVITAER